MGEGGGAKCHPHPPQMHPWSSFVATILNTVPDSLCKLLLGTEGTNIIVMLYLSIVKLYCTDQLLR